MAKYKNDPTVAFLFIDTREKDANYPKLVSNFLKENKYPFHVVFDEKNADGEMNVTYKSYVMPGIPTKYFIDAKGNIQYQSVGFKPGATSDEAAKEIERLIELTKTKA